MILITDTASFAEEMTALLDPTLRRLLMLRRDQLRHDTDNGFDLAELAHFVIVDPSDTIAEIEACAGFPLITSPAFEWVADHGGWYEAVTILSDDGFGIALFVPNRDDIDSALLTLLRDQADQPTTP